MCFMPTLGFFQHPRRGLHFVEAGPILALYMGANGMLEPINPRFGRLIGVDRCRMEVPKLMVTICFVHNGSLPLATQTQFGEEHYSAPSSGISASGTTAGSNVDATYYAQPAYSHEVNWLYYQIQSSQTLFTPQYYQTTYSPQYGQTAEIVQGGTTSDDRQLMPASYTMATEPVASQPIQAAPAPAGGDPYGFTAWLNAIRASYGLGPVGYDPNLANWASLNNSQQAARGIGHFVMGPARRQNSAIGSFPGIEAIWMASPVHRAALLDPTITWIGIAGAGAWWTFNAY
jgi:uncharacterized protein YkwD